MTKDELLNVPVVEKEKKVKNEVCDDAFLSTFTSAEKTSKEATAKVEEKVEAVKEEPKVVDANNDLLVDEDPGLFATEITEKKENVETKVEEVKAEPAVEDVKEEVVTDNVETVKVETTVSEEDRINAVVQAAEAKVGMNSQENGKNIELANNIVKESKIEENKNLPADVKPYVNMIKEKLMSFGKAALGLFEKIGDWVEGLLNKK